MVCAQDMGAFYTKWLNDIRDTQVRLLTVLSHFPHQALVPARRHTLPQIFDNDTNAVPDCAPFYGHGHTDSDPGEVAGARTMRASRAGTRCF